MGEQTGLRDDSCYTDWKQKASSKPLKYVTSRWATCDLEDCRDLARAEPGRVFNQETGISPATVDTSSKLRAGDKFGRSAQSPGVRMDTCLKRAEPQFKGGEVREDLNFASYRSMPFMGMGTGGGDANVDNLMRFGDATRVSRQKKTSGLAAPDRFETLHVDVQDPKNVIAPFPRGGHDTRNIDRYARQDASYII
jgi:hypothetical protein